MSNLAIDLSYYEQNVERVQAEIIQLWRPPPLITVSEWAEEKRILSAENCALPGPYRIAVTPYIREILEAVTDRIVEKIVMQKSAQVAWTDGVVNNSVGYYVDHDPAPMLILFPTENMAKRYSKEKLKPMIRDCACLHGKIAEAKSRDSENTILSKNFKGGHLELVGSNSPVNLSSSPIRIVIIEEPDRCAANSGGEGNSLKLTIERSKTFHNRKIILGGSPTIKGLSEIEREMESTDKRYFMVPCPHCGTFQRLTWSMVIWDKREGRNHEVFGDHVPESARFQCDHCRKQFSNAEKNKSLSAGYWEPTAEFTGAAGFYINELYATFPKSTVVHIAMKFLEANKALKSGDPLLMITFVNTCLGETWEEKGEGVEIQAIADRVEAYKKSEIDPGVLVITAAVDVQDDRLEYEVLGWGIGEETWSLDYGAIEGDPERPEAWKKLDDDALKKKWNRNGVNLNIVCACIDSGTHTNAVYKFVLPRQVRRVYAIKGSSKEAEPIVGRPSKKSLMKGLKLYPVGTDTAKTVIMGRLKIQEPGPGFCHFPDHYPDEYFSQLTAEKLVTRYVKGRAKRIWKKTRPRNEALDLRVYNMAAFNILNPNLNVISRKLKAAEKAAEEPDQPEETEKRPVARRKPRRPGRSKNFATNW